MQSGIERESIQAAAGRYRQLMVYAMMACVLTLSAAGIGIGASPPQVQLEQGLGRVVVFNAGHEPVSFLVEMEGSLQSRPWHGILEGYQAQEVFIQGEGEGIARFKAESDERQSLPSVEVRIRRDDEEGQERPQMDLLAWTAAVTFWTLMALAMLVARTHRGLKISHFKKSFKVAKGDD